MPQADIRIHLRDTETLDGFPLLRPRQTLHGDLTIIPDEDVRCKAVVLTVGWHTEGRGTRHAETVDTQTLLEGNLRAGIPAQVAFVVQLPEAPWSYQGKYVSVVWALEVKLDVPWGRDVRQTQPFVLRPAAPLTP